MTCKYLDSVHVLCIYVKWANYTSKYEYWRICNVSQEQEEGQQQEQQLLNS